MVEPKEALKPCPFCGGGGALAGIVLSSAMIVCRSCEAEGPIAGGGAGAIAAWNTRTPDIEALEAELIEQAKANGKGAEREAALEAKLAVAREALLRKRHDCLLQFVTQLAHAPRKPCTWMQIREAASDLLTQIDALTGGDNAEE